MTSSDRPGNRDSRSREHQQQDTEQTSVMSASSNPLSDVDPAAVSGSRRQRGGEAGAAGSGSSGDQQWQRLGRDARPGSDQVRPHPEPASRQGGHDGDHRDTDQVDPLTGRLSSGAHAQQGTDTLPGASGRSTVTRAGAEGTTGTSPRANSARVGSSRGPRRAALQVKRVDPWSVLKLALVLSIALFFVWMVAVGVLYVALDGMNVWEKLNGTYQDLTQGSATGEPLISATRVFTVAGIVGVVNIVLFTALATVSAFIYNISADMAGGVEVTLSERD